ncbi:unannotated protein [freshwater metagenome]|uniref:Unannotated protein n=1 Tax=freshwater metagenome TaxID=449393 RepID=A0A6J7F3J3_9ZZZZ|nr:hypothetical protein [Actinomycetota bacterium]
MTRAVNNTQYPDADATYWFTSYTLPVGATVHLSGEFAHARYESFNSYSSDAATDQIGIPADVLTDARIAAAPGSDNPFVEGARRDTTHRSFEVLLTAAGAPQDGSRAPNVLYTLPAGSPPPSAPVLQQVILRVYVPDRGRNAAGGVDLPAVSVALADGSVLSGDAACAALQATPALVASGKGRLDVETYRQLVVLGDPVTHPAFDPLRWQRFFNARFNVLAAFWSGTAMEPQIASLDAAPRKGFFGNLDADYGIASVNRHFGPDTNGHNVLVVRGRAPATPHTSNGETVMGGGQVRYWSICQNESPVTTRVSDCLYDEQIPVASDGTYTIVISLPGDRPANATASCGVAWMDWGAGDGVDRPEAGTLIVRHMLAAADFATTWARVAVLGSEAAVLGDYLPQGQYLDRAGFEQRGCPAAG